MGFSLKLKGESGKLAQASERKEEKNLSHLTFRLLGKIPIFRLTTELGGFYFFIPMLHKN
jgi:hypothetical protein